MSKAKSAPDKASATGYIIAAALVKLAGEPKWSQYFTPDMRMLNSAFARFAKDSLVKSVIDWLSAGLAVWLMDNLFVRGLMHHYIFRKRYIEEQVRRAIAAGTTQIINLGAGFDTLSLRLAKEFPQVRFIEIDRSVTQATKIRVLQQIGYGVPANVAFVFADLAQTSVAAALSTNNSANPALASLIVLEGVLMYLSGSEVETLFKDLRAYFQSRLTIVFGALAPTKQRDDASVKAINSMLSHGHEEPKWVCASKNMPQFVAAQGYILSEWVGYKQLQRLYLPEDAIRKVPEEDENYYIIEKQ